MATALASQAANTASGKKIHIGQQARPPCFQSDQRYLCKAICPWSHQCKKLIAEWLR